jgi:hypothetical protein
VVIRVAGIYILISIFTWGLQEYGSQIALDIPHYVQCSYLGNIKPFLDALKSRVIWHQNEKI